MRQIVSAAVLLLAGATAHAAPITYTLEGTITRVATTLNCTPQGVAVGQTITASVYYDPDSLAPRVPGSNLYLGDGLRYSLSAAGYSIYSRSEPLGVSTAPSGLYLSDGSASIFDEWPQSSLTGSCSYGEMLSLGGFRFSGAVSDSGAPLELLQGDDPIYFSMLWMPRLQEELRVSANLRIVSAVPEPAMLGLWAFGLLGTAASRVIRTRWR